MLRVLLVRVDFQEYEREAVEEAIANFVSGLRCGLHRGTATIDEIKAEALGGVG